MKFNEDFTRLSRLEDLGRWYVTHFVSDVASRLPPASRVLDAGAGECAYKRFFDHCRYVGVDLAVGDHSWNYGNLDCVTTLDHLPFANEAFDAVVCTQVLEHVARPVECLRELARVLKPSGRLFLTAPMSHREHQEPYDFFRYTSFGLHSVCGEAGFVRVDVKPFGGMFTRWAYELPRILEFVPSSGLRSGRASIKGTILIPVKIAMKVVIRVVQRLLLFLEPYDRQKSDPFGWQVVAFKA